MYHHIARLSRTWGRGPAGKYSIVLIQLREGQVATLESLRLSADSAITAHYSYAFLLELEC